MRPMPLRCLCLSFTLRHALFQISRSRPADSQYVQYIMHAIPCRLRGDLRARLSSSTKGRESPGCHRSAGYTAHYLYLKSAVLGPASDLPKNLLPVQ